MSGIGDVKTDLKFDIEWSSLRLRLSVADMTVDDVNQGFSVFPSSFYKYKGEGGPPLEFTSDTGWKDNRSDWRVWRQLRFPGNPIRVAPSAEGTKTINTLQGAPLEFTYMDVGFWGDGLPDWKVWKGIQPAAQNAVSDILDLVLPESVSNPVAKVHNPFRKRDPQKKKRDFGLVWGEWTCLCKYNNPQPGDGPDEDPLGDDNPLKILVDMLRQAEPVKKISVRRSLFTKARHGLTPDRTKLYVIVPDLHLPVVIGQPKSTEREAPMGRISPVSAPVPVLEFTKLDTSDADEVRDWYEQYALFNSFGSPEKQFMNDEDKKAFDEGRWDYDYTHTIPPARDLMEFLGKLQKCEIPGVKIVVVQVGDMYELWKGFECFFSKQQQQVVRYLDSPTLMAEEFVGYWVGRTNLLFRSLFKQFGKLSTIYMWGNHDNYLASYVNEYLSEAQTDPLDESEQEIAQLNSTALAQVANGEYPVHDKEVRVQGLLVEHGHRSDSFNWDGSIEGHEGTRKGFRNLGFNFFDEEWGTNRPARIHAAAVSFLISGDFCVYAMGHTHEAHLTRIVIEPNFV